MSEMTVGSGPGSIKKSERALKKKTVVCSSEAAAISIGIHLLVLLFAGSIVAMRYVHKTEAVFFGENRVRPKLERRQLQMPVKVKNMQRKASRPKVSSRMASVAKSSFALPDIMGPSSVSFDRSGGGDRSLSQMGSVGSLGFGVVPVNFFGARAKGEKLVFVIECGEAMLTDDKGGYYSFSFAKDRIHKMVDGMQSATLFNVILYNYGTATMFSPKLLPASAANRARLKDWLEPVNANAQQVGDIAGIGFDYSPRRDYQDSPLYGDKPKAWSRAVQAAMEQGADNIFVLCADSGRNHISHEKKKEMFGLDLDTKEEWLRSKGWPPEKVEEYKRKKEEIYEKARAKLAKENKEREEKGQPPKILDQPAMWKYVWDTLGYEIEHPPDMIRELARHEYVIDELVDHAEAVYEANYKGNRQKKPKVHFVQMVASDGRSDDGGAQDEVRNLKTAAKAFRGEFEFLRGAKTMEDLLSFNPELNE